ncbi:uncharacterized protein LOC124917985 isoform X2 [Impatiens glandulifera]|uniref:uncharacterized protein LOC124917985 isoform X2 n=1 Tax=Impatiens glandulifera TaxID=253017 RepID=UPI001FB081B1|nr:uncharacterized protein LOC124917985 isoform X2 [Impatiens glandulifera]
MNQYAVQLNNCTSYEEIKSSFSGSVSIISDRRVERESVFCPKPRRFPLANSAVNDPIRPLKWYQSNQVEPCESRVGIDLLDIILPNSSKAGVGVGVGDQLYSQLGSSPPFFCGSPPSRVSNPLIQDVRFRDEMFTPISPPTQVGGSSSPRKGGCMMITNFGNNPTVRVEGFDCLDRDRQRNCSIPTLA